MGAQQQKQVVEGQNFSDYYAAQNSHTDREMKYIEKLAAKLCSSADEIKTIHTFLEQRGYTFSNRLLGKGGTSVVLRAQNIMGQSIALKILSCNSKADYLGNLQEYRLMKQSNSEHVIKVHELLEYRLNNKLIQFLAMERCLYNLQSQMTSDKKFHQQQVYDICLQLAKGLNDLHNQNILHLDIKPGNIVLGHDNKWKFIDLGLSKLVTQNQPFTEESQGLTKYYCSPEQYQLFYEIAKPKLGKSSDVYSLGLVFLELTGIRFKDEAQIEESKKKRINIESLFNPEYEELNKLISKMLTYNPDHRNNLSQVKNYLTQLVQEESSTTGGSDSPSNNLLSLYQLNAPIVKDKFRSRSIIKSDNLLEFKRKERQKSLYDLSSMDNISYNSPYQLQKLEQKQIEKSMLAKKLPTLDVTPTSRQIKDVSPISSNKLLKDVSPIPSRKQSRDASPMQSRKQIILPSLRNLPSNKTLLSYKNLSQPLQIQSQNNTFTKFFFQYQNI